MRGCLALGGLAGCLERMEACPLQAGDRTQHRISQDVWPDAMCSGQGGVAAAAWSSLHRRLARGAPCGPLVNEVSWGAALGGIAGAGKVGKLQDSLRQDQHGVGPQGG